MTVVSWIMLLRQSTSKKFDDKKNHNWEAIIKIFGDDREIIIEKN